MKLFLKRMFSIVLALAGLLLLFHLVENWRGARALAQWRQASLAAGMPETLEEMAPPKIPDAENFATHPSVVAAISGKPESGGPVLPAIFSEGEVYRAWEEGHAVDLEALKATLNVNDLGSVIQPFAGQLQGLEDASLRPHCRLMPVYNTEIPALLGMRQRARALSLRAIISLREGRTEAALADVLTILRVTKHLEQEPHLISQLLRIAYVKLSFQPIWEGLQAHRWNDQQLGRLQGALAGIDLLNPWRRTWLSESVYHQEQMAQMAIGPLSSARYLNEMVFGPGRASQIFTAAFIPKGWLYQNLITICRRDQAQYVEVIDPVRHLLDSRKSDSATDAWTRISRTPYNFVAKGYVGDFSGQNIRLGHAQAMLDQAGVACALERHRLVHKSYPEDLAELLPRYLPKLPIDLIGGASLRYRRQLQTAYLLYGLGWNWTDEGGKTTFDSKQPRRHMLEQGDWVWAGSNQ